MADEPVSALDVHSGANSRVLDKIRKQMELMLLLLMI